MSVLTGLDVVIRDDLWQGVQLGVVCNQASVARDRRHILDHLGSKVAKVFGPQHGLWGHTQDNMIEWEGRLDPRLGVPVISLYGVHRKPTPEMLSGLDRLVIDLQDVGARYYTFIWTMALCLEACAEVGLPVTVLDRPNPLGGVAVEGPMLEPEFSSFVGLYPLPIRHGLTIGEIASWLAEGAHGLPGNGFDSRSVSTTGQTVAPPDLVRMEGWSREMSFDETGLPWVMPSPNMPTVDTAFVYPGGCLLEGTNLSEGRGTTKPFEQFGAPFIDGAKLCSDMNQAGLPGCWFRYVEFQPTSGKWIGEVCQGAFVHVLNRQVFRPFETYVTALWHIRRQCGDKLEWRTGPYEYEFEKRPIDIIFGNGWMADHIDAGAPVDKIIARGDRTRAPFDVDRSNYLLY